MFYCYFIYKDDTNRERQNVETCLTGNNLQCNNLTSNNLQCNNLTGNNLQCICCTLGSIVVKKGK